LKTKARSRQRAAEAEPRPGQAKDASRLPGGISVYHLIQVNGQVTYTLNFAVIVTSGQRVLMKGHVTGGGLIFCGDSIM